MSWYAAHNIMYVRFKDKRQDKYPIWENIILIEAESEEQAIKKATKIGREAEGDSSDTFYWEDRPAIWVFAGVRKLIECQSNSERPNDGTEITYSEMLLDCEESLSKLVSGQTVTILYKE